LGLAQIVEHFISFYQELFEYTICTRFTLVICDCDYLE
jgi:hypothetical protein